MHVANSPSGGIGSVSVDVGIVDGFVEGVGVVGGVVVGVCVVGGGIVASLNVRGMNSMGPSI